MARKKTNKAAAARPLRAGGGDADHRTKTKVEVFPELLADQPRVSVVCRLPLADARMFARMLLEAVADEGAPGGASGAMDGRAARGAASPRRKAKG